MAQITDTPSELVPYDERCVAELINLAFNRLENSSDYSISPELKVLADRLSKNGGSDYSAADAHLEAGNQYRNHNDFPSAHAHYRAAFAHTAPELGALICIAAAWMNEGRHETAANTLKRLSTWGREDPGFVMHLAHALWNSGEHAEALEQCDILLSTHPDHAGGLDTVRIMHGQRGDSAKALEACLALASRSSIPLGKRVDYLQEATLLAIKTGSSLPDWHTKSLEEIAAPTDEQIKATATLEMIRLRSSSFAIWRSILTEHEQLSPTLTRPDRDTLTSFLAAEPSASVLSLSDDAGLAARFGGAVIQADAFQRDGFTLPRNSGVLERGWMTTVKDERITLNIAATRVQLDTIKSGAVTLHSPFGGVVSSSTSFVLNYEANRRECGSVLAYFFRLPRPCFVFFASEDFWPLAWYDPIEHVILLHEGMGDFKEYLRDRVRELKRVCLADPLAAAAYIEAERSRFGGQSTLLFGLMEYLSTYVFADLGGIVRVLNSSVLDKIESILVLAPEPIEQIENLFPELLATPIDRQLFVDVCDVNRHLWTTNSFAVRVTGGFVIGDLAACIVQSAKREAQLEWRQRVDSLAQNCFPVIFVALRAHGRRWLISGSEVAAIFTQLRNRYPKLGLIFDGHAATDNPVPPTIAERETKLIESIRVELPPDMPVLVSAGRKMMDGIFAACVADCHLSAQGTTATKGALIAGRPGVVVGSRQFGWDVRAFREPCPELLTPWQNAVDLVEGDIQCDYTLDPNVVAEALIQVVSSLDPTRQTSG